MYSLLAVASLSRIIHPASLEKQFRKEFKFKFPRSPSNCASLGCAGQTSLVHQSSTSQVTRFKESQRSCGVLCDGLELLIGGLYLVTSLFMLVNIIIDLTVVRELVV